MPKIIPGVIINLTDLLNVLNRDQEACVASVVPRISSWRIRNSGSRLEILSRELS